MAHAHVLEAGPGLVHAMRAFIAAALCVSALAMLCAGTLINGTGTHQGASAEATGDAVAAPAAADRSSAQNEHDGALQPRIDGLGVRHVWRKPRRTNRRLRVPGRDIPRSGAARGGALATGGTHLTLNRKRTSKRALMRRLMTVRGGLQA